MRTITLCLFLAAAVHAAFPGQSNLSATEKLNMLSDKVNMLDYTVGSPEAKRILVVGDSWADVVAGGSVLGDSFFTRKLKEHGCSAAVKNIAVPGTMVTDWNAGTYLDTLKKQAKVHDYVWISLMGNDALIDMADCAGNKSKTADQCGDELYAKMIPGVGSILDAIHESNPNARVVVFGYDTMFGGLGCHYVASSMFPQCWKLFSKGGNRCFNTQFLRIQAVWDEVAKNRSWVDPINIIGVTQMAAGNTKASIGHPDMDSMGPAKYWPDYLGCFHPSVYSTQKDGSGAMIIMEEFYKQYWGKQLGCGNSTNQVLDPVLV